jgi:hypothetical protein
VVDVLPLQSGVVLLRGANRFEKVRKLHGKQGGEREKERERERHLDRVLQEALLSPVLHAVIKAGHIADMLAAADLPHDEVVWFIYGDLLVLRQLS